MSDIIYGINPVRELLRSGAAVDKAYISKHKGPAAALAMELRDRGVPVIDCDDRRLDSICAAPFGCFTASRHSTTDHSSDRAEGSKTTPNHQGIAVAVAAAEYSTMEDIYAAAEQKGEPPLIVLLDGITDPHNMGAIIRSAEALGAHGVVTTQRRSAGLNATVHKASSGAVAHMKVVRVGNLPALIEQLKQRGIWVCGGEPNHQRSWDANMSGPLAICIGAEGEGLSRLVKERCDFLAGIPLVGKTQSLNASCAASIIIYEALRQRTNIPKIQPREVHPE